MEVVPEMGSPPVLQHQIWIKPEMSHIKSTHIPLIHLSLSVPIKDFHHNPRITEINSFIDANKPAPDLACEISIHSEIRL